MATKYILATLAAVFLGMALVPILTGRAAGHPQVRTWLIIGVMFTLVSAWLFYKK